MLDVDEYGDPIEGYGYCALEGDVAAGCFSSLVIFVTLCIIAGNVVCYISRNDESVNSEVTYISISMMNFMQIWLVGMPVAVILVEKPLSRFLVSAFAALASFMGLVLMIFVPKIMAITFEDQVNHLNIQQAFFSLHSPHTHTHTHARTHACTHDYKYKYAL